MEFIKWALGHKKHWYKLVILFPIGLIGCIFLLPEAYSSDSALVAKIMITVALVGFTSAIVYQPYTIYKRLKRMGEL
jgi:Na+/H+ antiporter NhaB